MKNHSRMIADKVVHVACDDSIPEVDIAWLLNYIERTFSTGEIPEAPKCIQVGMMLIQAAISGAHVTFHEPDMVSMPMKFVDGVTHSLQTLRLQKDVYESLDLEADFQFPNIRQCATQCSRWADSTSYIIERSEPEAMHSGWFFLCQDPQHDHGAEGATSLISLYEIAIGYPETVPFLALPMATTVLVDGDLPFIYVNGVEKSPRANSFLSRYLVRKEQK